MQTGSNMLPGLRDEDGITAVPKPVPARDTAEHLFIQLKSYQ
jgi:hypothetical protein